MRQGDALPAVAPEDGFGKLVQEMSAKGLGAAAIVDAQRRVLGIFTDGDLRRALERGVDLREVSAQDVMHEAPKTIGPDALAAQAAELMESASITSVLVVDAQGVLVGAINTNDLMRAKVI